MKNFFFMWIYSTLLLSGCSTANAPGGEEPLPTTGYEVGDEDVIVHSTMGSSDINGWWALDDNRIVIDTIRYGELIATFMSPCRGIRFADVIGFNTMGPFDLDRTTRVFLPDGTVCHFKELRRYIKLDKSSGDSDEN